MNTPKLKQKESAIKAAIADDPPPLNHAPQPLVGVLIRYVYRALKTHKYNRSETAQALNVSVRMIRTYVKDMRKVGAHIPKPTIESLIAKRAKFKIDHRKNWIERLCAHCGKAFLRPRYRNFKTVFCDNTCKSNHQVARHISSLYTRSSE